MILGTDQSLRFVSTENMCAFLSGIACLALLTLLWLMRTKASRSPLPPGPLGVPLLGYLPWLDPVQPYKTLTRLVSQYGPVFSVRLGSVPCVVLADNTIIKEVFSRDEVSGRPPLYLFSWLLENSGIIFSEARLVSDGRNSKSIKTVTNS